MKTENLRLPTRDGISPSCVALPPGGWPTLLDFLAQRFPAIERAEWSARMERGEVLSADGSPLAPECPFRPHAKVFYYRSLPHEEHIPFEETLLYQDEHLLVVDKPHFLPVLPSGRYLHETLLVRMKRRLGIDTLSPIHRIDRETAGLVLFSVQPETRDRYQSLFRQRAVDKRYEAIALLRRDLDFPFTYRSRLEEGASFMQMHEVAGEPNAETRIELLEAHGNHARYRLFPVTGKKHQLRAHMSALGMPILNDRIYPILLPEERDADALAMAYGSPLQLLAKCLAFTDPLSGRKHCFESGLALQW